jgi:mucin-19
VATNGGGQTYSSPVVLQAAANVVDTLNGAVKFVGALDGTTAGGQSLTVTAGNGIVTFGGAVGANVALGTLSVTGPTTLLGDVQTIGKQTFNSAVTLGATAAVTALNNSVDFAGTVNAATAGVQGLTVTAGNGTVTFNDVVGGTAALASLTVSGPTTLAGNVRTTGTQTYNSAVTLRSP